MVGPNCLGVINAESDACYNASFANQTPMSGSLAFVSQSGALCTSVLDFAAQREMGFSKFVSFGNKADVNEVDLLNYLAEDDKTKVVAMYLEAIGDGEGFTKAVRKLLWEKNKPVLILKSGRSAAGAKAVSSHTGSLAGNDAVYEALLKQSGAIRVDSIEQLFDYAALFCNQIIPVMMSKDLFADIYEQRGASRTELAVDIENSAAIIVTLVPWCLMCSVPLGFMGVGYGAMKYAVYVYAVPLCYLLTKKRFKFNV